MSDCPHPEKRRHDTYQAAVGHRRAIEKREGRIDIALKPYRCGDHYHLGHRPGSGKGGLNGKIRRALKVGRL